MTTEDTTIPSAIADDILLLPAESDIYHGAELHAALTAHVAAHASVVLDLSRVTASDLTTLQLVAAARASARAAGKTFSAINPSTAFLECCAASGIAPEDLGADASVEPAQP